jgi:chorismate synthase
VGVTLDGLPPGFSPDWDAVRAELARRAPGSDETATSRREPDTFEVLSGMFNDRFTGAPLTAVCRNADTRSADYTPELPRPGHADWVSRVKYRGFGDYRGGGRFSGRLTAPLVFAGALAKQMLAAYEVAISARAVSIHGETDKARQREAILEAKARGDSVGGVIECIATGAFAGWGNPMFASLESELSGLLFSIPAVKGVEFGDGFGFANRYGAEVSDGYAFDDEGDVTLLANHNGGILGGITTGQPIVVRVAVKPTPTIAIPQRTVNLETHEEVTHSFGGRHDPCIVPRALPVVEAAVALALVQYVAN